MQILKRENKNYFQPYYPVITTVNALCNAFLCKYKMNTNTNIYKNKTFYTCYFVKIF